MDIIEEQEIKREFQLERVLLFSDAVFAIIITIMVLEIKMPEDIKHADAEQVKDAFLDLIPKLLAYMLSFFLVARFWVVHLNLFSFLRDYDLKLVVYNLLFLFCVSLFPFAATLISGKPNLHLSQYAWGIDTYIVIMLSCFFTQSLLVRYMVSKKATLCYQTDKLEEKLHWQKLRLHVYAIPFFIPILVAFNYFSFPAFFALYLVAGYMAIMRLISRILSPGKENEPMMVSLVRNRLKNRRERNLTQKN